MPDPRSACPFPPRWNSSGGGAATRALGPITSSFIGSAKQHQGGFSMEYQRRPCTARKVFARLLLTLSAICILCFFSFLPLLLWGCGQSWKWILPLHKRSSLLIQAWPLYNLKGLPFYSGVFSFPSLLTPSCWPIHRCHDPISLI